MFAELVLVLGFAYGLHAAGTESIRPVISIFAAAQPGQPHTGRVATARPPGTGAAGGQFHHALQVEAGRAIERGGLIWAYLGPPEVMRIRHDELPGAGEDEVLVAVGVSLARAES